MKQVLNSRCVGFLHLLARVSSRLKTCSLCKLLGTVSFMKVRQVFQSNKQNENNLQQQPQKTKYAS